MYDRSLSSIRLKQVLFFEESAAAYGLESPRAYGGLRRRLQDQILTSCHHSVWLPDFQRRNTGDFCPSKPTSDQWVYGTHNIHRVTVT